jgi:hypothetical protein
MDAGAQDGEDDGGKSEQEQAADLAAAFEVFGGGIRYHLPSEGFLSLHVERRSL